MAKDFRNILMNLKKELPPQYAVAISKAIDEPAFTPTKVMNVFLGRVTDIESVGIVIGGAKKVIENRTKLAIKAISIKKTRLIKNKSKKTA